MIAVVMNWRMPQGSILPRALAGVSMRAGLKLMLGEYSDAGEAAFHIDTRIRSVQLRALRMFGSTQRSVLGLRSKN